MGRHLILEIGHDHDTDQPDRGYDGWKLISFGRRHSNYEDPDKYIKRYNREEGVVVNGIGLQRKLQVGLAFWLSYYEHGQGAWSLLGEGTQCRWDTAYLAGLLVWTGKPGDIGAKTLEGRAEDARNFLESFNDWANGNCYWFRLTDEGGEEIDSFGGLIGSEALSEVVGEELKPGDSVLVVGDGAWLRDYLELPDGVKLVAGFADRDEPATPEYVI
jgi:hypothetical protein